MRHTFILKYLIIISFFMTGNLKAQTIEVEVNENVELMSILSRMAGFPEYSMDLGGQYITDMDSCFRKHRSHPTVSYMTDLRKNTVSPSMLLWIWLSVYKERIMASS